MISIWSVAHILCDNKQVQSVFVPRPQPAGYQQWGFDLEPQAVQQMDKACQLPIAAAGADARCPCGLWSSRLAASWRRTMP